MLLKTRAQLEHAMKETEHPLRVNSENIYTRWSTYICQNLTFEMKTVMNREGRMGIDRVSDAVEANLHSEVTFLTFFFILIIKIIITRTPIIIITIIIILMMMQ